MPGNIATQAGHYDIMALLPGDNTFARGSLFMLEPGTKVVLFDLDGTITVGDQQVVAQFALSAMAASTAVGDKHLAQAYDQKARANARTAVRLWAAKGCAALHRIISTCTLHRVQACPVRGLHPTSFALNQLVR